MSINQLSLEKQHQSRNMQSDILHAVAETKQVNVAKCLGVESSTVGRWLDAKNPESQVVRFCDILALCGLKVVPASAKCYDAEKMAILFRVTKYHFQNLEEVDDFFENDAGMPERPDVRFSRTGDLSDIKTTPKSVLALLASFCEACKSLVATKSNTNRPTVLVARLNLENEIKQERQDIVADDAAFWKTALILSNIVGLFILLTMTFRFWGL